MCPCSVNMPWRKTFLMSSWWICHFLDITKDKTRRIVAWWTTGNNISWKSIAACWWLLQQPNELCTSQCYHQTSIYPIDPLNSKQILSRIIRNEFPCIISHQHIKLIRNSLLPLRFWKSFLELRSFSFRTKRGEERERGRIFGLGDTRFRPGLHRMHMHW